MFFVARRFHSSINSNVNMNIDSRKDISLSIRVRLLFVFLVNEWPVNAHRNSLSTSVPDNCDLFRLRYSSSSPLRSLVQACGACILRTWCLLIVHRYKSF